MNIDVVIVERKMNRKQYYIYPATIGAAYVACSLFGRENVNVGNSWLDPIIATITDEEYEAGKDYLAEIGLNMRSKDGS